MSYVIPDVPLHGITRRWKETETHFIP